MLPLRFFQKAEAAGAEFKKTKEQIEAEKKVAMSVRIKPLPLDFDKMTGVQLKAYAKEIWENIVCMEKELYDLQERQKRQDYDVNILSTLSCFEMG